MKKKLSKRQQSIYEYICSYSAEHGYPPSVREIGAAVGLASPSTVHMHLQVLQEQGLIKRDSKKPRAIEVVNNPSEHDEGLHLAKVTEDPDSNTISLPLVGRVAAGQPILAEQNVEERLQSADQHRRRCIIFRPARSWRVHDQCRHLRR
jgi:repressor LexA